MYRLQLLGLNIARCVKYQTNKKNITFQKDISNPTWTGLNIKNSTENLHKYKNWKCQYTKED